MEAELEVICPRCGTEWALTAEESENPEFLCGTCGVPFQVQAARRTEKNQSEAGAVILSDITIITIRLFAIWTGLEILFFATLWSFNSFRVSYLLPMGIAMALVAILWAGAPFIAKAMNCGRNGIFSCPNLDLSDLYCFGFVLTGVYFFTGVIGPAVTTLYALIAQGDTGGGRGANSLESNLVRWAIQIILGGLLMLKARSFATWLLRRQEKSTSLP